MGKYIFFQTFLSLSQTGMFSLRLLETKNEEKVNNFFSFDPVKRPICPFGAPKINLKMLNFESSFFRLFFEVKGSEIAKSAISLHPTA